MKNKFVSKWLHRLPVLLLTLILAVVPFTMAAPAHADVLVGDVAPSRIGYTCIYSYYNPYDSSFDGPSALNVFASDHLIDNYKPQVFCLNPDDSSLYLITASSIVLNPNNGYATSFLNETLAGSFTQDVYVDTNGVSCVDVFIDSLESHGDMISFNYPDNGLVFYNSFVRVKGPLNVVMHGLFPVHDSVGILSVFSGVGSWLSRAVQNISTMFWTAESGMSVLGYLAVASLALAVILSIFYLIAGWLKFH